MPDHSGHLCQFIQRHVRRDLDTTEGAVGAQCRVESPVMRRDLLAQPVV